jgi:hypothetical protein
MDRVTLLEFTSEFQFCQKIRFYATGRKVFANGWLSFQRLSFNSNKNSSQMMQMAAVAKLSFLFWLSC